jgi:hypothetical protein
MTRKLIAALWLLNLTGCSYNAAVLDTPSFSVASSFGSKVAGTWLLYVDAHSLEREVKTSSYACSFHKFPIQINGAFQSSVNETFANLLEHVEVVPSPMNLEQAKARGAKGIIIVRGDDVRPRLEVKPGFWSATMEAQATIVASLTVDGPKGRLLGTTVEGQGFATSESGAACSGGAKALSDAVGQGMGDTMRKLGEAVTNSERMRGA